MSVCVNKAWHKCFAGDIDHHRVYGLDRLGKRMLDISDLASALAHAKCERRNAPTSVWPGRAVPWPAADETDRSIDARPFTVKTSWARGRAVRLGADF